MTAPDPVPPILWHYTSLDALLKIAISESIWASDVRCLNDATEFEYGRQITMKAIEAYQAASSGFLERVKPIAAEQGLHYRYFAFSMSERDDLLSQWRSYCPPVAGCSIGFDSNALSRAATYDEGLYRRFNLIKCVYSEPEQTAMIDEVLATSYEVAQGIHPSRTGSFLGGGFGSAIPRFKHPSFQEECEWRLIQSRDVTPRDYKSPSDYEDPIEYRMGKSTIVPYVKIPLKPLPITEIKLGPCPHPELSEATVKSFLATHKLAAAVTHSRIPYRAW
jgi:hypothetical protein